MKTHFYTQGFANLTLIIGIVLILLIAAFILSVQSDEEVAQPATETTEVAEESELQSDEIEVTEVAETETTDIQVEEPVVVTEEAPTPIFEASEPTVLAAAKGVFTDYDASLIANAENGDVILFFHASWCPSCRALENDINSDLSAIPDGVTILQIDYDSATELKKKYGVVRQHTLVQVDADGSEIKKLTGLTNTLDQVINQI